MIDETIKKIEERLKESPNMQPQRKEDLLALLEKLKLEVSSLSETNQDDAHSIVKLTDLSAHEATKEKQNSHLIKLSVDGLSNLAKNFETSHPQLASAINNFCLSLSGMGI
ncbi:MAG: DUF4404 family protein [Candidatus Caenarcaniphilales bacterium]|nr:DUF4404 family protein [Candidatus Caenarcaniphilales bacterium]